MKGYIAKAKELLFPMLLLGAGIGILIVSNDITLNTALEKGIVNARFYPRMVGLVIISVSIFELVISIKKILSIDIKQVANKANSINDNSHFENARRLAVFISIVLVYQVLFFIVGFFTSTLIFLLVAFKFLGCTSKVKLILTSVIITLSMYFTFTMALKVYLPRSILW